jgi:hypothetical protein
MVVQFEESSGGLVIVAGDEPFDYVQLRQRNKFTVEFRKTPGFNCLLANQLCFKN